MGHLSIIGGLLCLGVIYFIHVESGDASPANPSAFTNYKSSSSEAAPKNSSLVRNRRQSLSQTCPELVGFENFSYKICHLLSVLMIKYYL